MRKQETMDRFNRVKALVSEGSSIKDACEEVKLSQNVYYTIIREDKKKISRRKEKNHQFVDLEAARVHEVSNDKIAIVFCPAKALKAILESL